MARMRWGRIGGVWGSGLASAQMVSVRMAGEVPTRAMRMVCLSWWGGRVWLRGWGVAAGAEAWEEAVMVGRCCVVVGPEGVVLFLGGFCFWGRGILFFIF